MKRVFQAALLSCLLGTSAHAQDTLKIIYNDLGVKLSGIDANCFSTMITKDDGYGAECLEVNLPSSYAKDRLNSYFQDYLDKPWNFYESLKLYTNSFQLKDDLYRIEVKSKDDYTSYINIFSFNRFARLKKLQATEQADLDRKAALAGATPNVGYVSLSDLAPILKSNVVGTVITLQKGGLTIVANRGIRSATLNGMAAKLNADPIILDGSNYFPLTALSMLKCSYSKKGTGIYLVECARDGTIVDLKQFSNKNPSASPLIVPTVVSVKAATKTPAIPATESIVPEGALKGVAYITASSLSGAGSLNIYPGGIYTLTVGEKSLSFADGQLTSPEGIGLPAAPYLQNEVLFVPLASLKILGCSVNRTDLTYTATCPGGNSIDGVVVIW